MRKGSKVKVNKVKSKELVLQFFVVFLKCTLERRLEGFQQARQFWKKVVNEMIKIDIGFKISEADPYLLYRETNLEYASLSYMLMT